MVETTRPPIEYCLNAMKHARIMATEAYLDQDGKSIIAASDFKDIEQYLLEAIETTECTVAGEVANSLDGLDTVNSVNSSEISVVDEDYLMKVAIAVDNRLESVNWPMVGTGRLMDALRPYLRQLKPVSGSVSLEKCMRELAGVYYDKNTFSKGHPFYGIGRDEYIDRVFDDFSDDAKVVLETAGVKYVD